MIVVVVIVLVLVLVLAVLYGRQSNRLKSYLPQNRESFIHVPLDNWSHIRVFLLPLLTDTAIAVFTESSKIPSIFLKKVLL